MKKSAKKKFLITYDDDQDLIPVECTPEELGILLTELTNRGYFCIVNQEFTNDSIIFN